MIIPTSSTAVATGAHSISIEHARGRVVVKAGGRVLADSENALVLNEADLDPVYYFPRSDVRMDLMTPTQRQTFCPFRGDANYWSLDLGGNQVENLAWSYEDPFEPSRQIKNLVAFDRDRVDSIVVGETIARTNLPPAEEGPDSLSKWLLESAWSAITASDLIAQFADCLNEMGMSLVRLNVVVKTLHPQFIGTRYLWTKEDHQVQENDTAKEVLESREYYESPIYVIRQGAGAVRRKLADDSDLDFPILKELKAEGVTDYIAMPLNADHSDIITIATDNPEGFQSEQLTLLYQALPLFNRLLEVHGLRRIGVNILETYLGTNTGRRVLDGKVRRGDGDDIHAVIWFCDLRESTPLADSMSRGEFLALLNTFFDCVAGAILDHGGEVLRFIGDAVLAIFPVTQEQDPDALRDACQSAMNAAAEADARIRLLNEKRASKKRKPLGYGIALHVGDVTYGNIGTASRLEFTVIGAAANEAARIESMCKSLGREVLLSEAFVKHLPGDYCDLGQHELKGISRPISIYSIR